MPVIRPVTGDVPSWLHRAASAVRSGPSSHQLSELATGDGGGVEGPGSPAECRSPRPTGSTPPRRGSGWTPAVVVAAGVPPQAAAGRGQSTGHELLQDAGQVHADGRGRRRCPVPFAVGLPLPSSEAEAVPQETSMSTRPVSIGERAAALPGRRRRRTAALRHRLLRALEGIAGERRRTRSSGTGSSTPWCRRTTRCQKPRRRGTAGVGLRPATGRSGPCRAGPATRSLRCPARSTA